jgi:hypothetical protein
MKTVSLCICLFIFVFPWQAKAQLKLGDQPTILNKAVALDVQGSSNKQGLWLPRVTDTSITGIRALNPPNGLLIFHSTSGKMLLRSNNSWISYLTNALTTINAGGQNLTGPTINLQTGSSAGVGNDVNITGNAGTNVATINIPDASGTVRGVVTTGAQTIGGAKTFNSALTVSSGGVAVTAGGVTINGGGLAVNSGGATVSGATGSTSNLTLGVTSATTTSTVTNKNLTVDASGNVVLAQNYVTAPAAVNIRSFAMSPTPLPTTIAQASATTFTFNFPAGTNLKLTSTVTISPSSNLAGGCGLGWARVTSGTQIQASFFSGYTSQAFLAGYIFYITVVEF